MALVNKLNSGIIKFSIFLLSLTLFLSNCKNESNDSTNSKTYNSNFRINCVTLAKSQIQAWVDSGWTNPTNDTIKYLILQLLTPEPAVAEENMQLICYPAKDYTKSFPKGEKILAIDTNCVSLKLTDTTIFSNNYVRFRLLKLTNSDGTLKDFDFVRFRPVMKFSKYISYEMEVVRLVGIQKTEDILVRLADRETADPCPPYCPSEVD
jgi:hypothetical protein